MDPSGIVSRHAAAHLFDAVVDDRGVKREVTVLLPVDEGAAPDEFDFECGRGLELDAEGSEEGLLRGGVFAGDGLAVNRACVQFVLKSLAHKAYLQPAAHQAMTEESCAVGRQITAYEIHSHNPDTYVDTFTSVALAFAHLNKELPIIIVGHCMQLWRIEMIVRVLCEKSGAKCHLVVPALSKKPDLAGYVRSSSQRQAKTRFNWMNHFQRIRLGYVSPTGAIHMDETSPARGYGPAAQCRAEQAATRKRNLVYKS